MLAVVTICFTSAPLTYNPTSPGCRWASRGRFQKPITGLPGAAYRSTAILYFSFEAVTCDGVFYLFGF